MRKPAILAVMLWLVILPPAAAAPSAPAAKIPIILDTDIGTDIDDAFALALIVASPELQLLGVTTVSGDTRARARLAAKLLAEAGGAWRRVPVYAGEPGAAQPIDQTRWAEGFSSPALHESGAVGFLKTEIDRRPGEVTIIAIGALTNVAALLKSNPLMAKKIRRIALMGGSVARGYAADSQPEPEWNIKSDPEAAQAVFSSGVPILMAPLDVTAMLRLDEAGRRRVFTHLTPLTNALAVLYFLWGKEAPVLFDPMVVALLVNPRLCELKPLAIAVDSQGYTRVVEGKPANAEVGLRTDPAKFFDFYLGRVAP
ncbi:MAG TPA: nucleoside hydrolase [Terriglobia bacterium]|nr:nucleoside hydrolase [Terriglobia bacterium]